MFQSLWHKAGHSANTENVNMEKTTHTLNSAQPPQPEAVSGTVLFLTEELERRMKKNPRYSLRAFALSLRLSPGELSEIMRGKRRLSVKGALKITQALALPPETAQSFLTQVQQEEGRAAGIPVDPKKNLQRRDLSIDLFHAVSEWYCFAILNLAETQGFKFHSKHIARRLGISETQAKLALDRLERIGLLERTNGTLRATPDFVLSPDGIQSEAIRNYHAQILNEATRALTDQSIDERFFSGVSFAMDPKRMKELKKELSTFLDQWAERVSKLDPHTRTEVYHLETLLFRLTKSEEKK